MTEARQSPAVISESKLAAIKRGEKQLAALRLRLLGAAHLDPHWHLAIKALEKAIAGHLGVMRKDGVTPYVHHPVQVALYLLTLPRLDFPVETIAAGLMHDLLEDTNVQYAELLDEFGNRTAGAVRRLSKKVDGMVKDSETYKAEIWTCPIASIVKPGDRISNQNTMADCFTPAKQIAQIVETEDYIIPGMKTSRRRFSTQELSYENAKLVLQTQVDLVRYMHPQHS